MSPQQSLLTKSPPTLNIYRHLLRECSYLPPALRGFIASTVQDRFHRNRHDEDGLAAAHLRRARNALRTIRAANHGSRSAMTNLVDKAFGRAGSRRRELMATFVKSSGPQDSAALGTTLSTQSNTKNSKQNQSLLQKWDLRKLTDILASQKKQQAQTRATAGWPGSLIRTLNHDTETPKLTPWQQPPTDKLVQTKRRKWWKRHADKIMPPLGKGEWELLQRLSANAQESDADWRVPPRRSYAVQCSPERPVDDMEWQRYATQNAATVERDKHGDSERRSGQVETSPYGTFVRQGALPARWFRRAYERTWNRTPYLEQHPNTMRYTFKWGNRASAVLPAGGDTHAEFFGATRRTETGKEGKLKSKR